MPSANDQMHKRQNTSHSPSQATTQIKTAPTGDGGIAQIKAHKQEYSMAASHWPSAIPEVQQAPSNAWTPQYQWGFDQQQPLAEHLGSRPQQQHDQTPPQASQTSMDHTYHTASAKLTVEYQQGRQCRLHCNLWQGGCKFLWRKNNKNHHIGESSVKGVAMPRSRIMAVTFCREPSEPQHQHPPIGSPKQAPESNRLYTVQTTKRSRKHIWALLSHTNREE